MWQYNYHKYGNNKSTITYSISLKNNNRFNLDVNIKLLHKSIVTLTQYYTVEYLINYEAML